MDLAIHPLLPLSSYDRNWRQSRLIFLRTCVYNRD
jgi:hypothetical protein